MLTLDPGEHPLDVEDRFWEHLRPGDHAGQDPRLQPEHVEVGTDHQVPVVRTQPGHVHPVGGDTQRPAMGHDDALGQPRGPGGEEDVRGVAPLRAMMSAASPPLKERVDRHEDRACLPEAEHGDDPFGAVEGPDRHAVSGSTPDATSAAPNERAASKSSA